METKYTTKQKKLISDLIKENIDLYIDSKSPNSIMFDVYYNDRCAGSINCIPAPSSLGEDTNEIIDLFLEEEYANINVAKQTIQSLWEAFPKINRLVVNIPNESLVFWEKLGFQRLNDYYHMVMRGH